MCVARGQGGTKVVGCALKDAEDLPGCMVWRRAFDVEQEEETATVPLGA